MANTNHEFNAFLQMLNKMKEIFHKMSEEERFEFIHSFISDSLTCKLENNMFYRYKKPDYQSKSIREIRWLGPFWNAQNEDDKIMLCKFVEDDIKLQGLTQAFMKEEIRGYIYHLFANFDPDHHENHWRLFGPFLMMEKLQMTDGLDLVLESLRQDAFFINNYFDGFYDWISAIIYQLGKDQIDVLEQFMYEQGIIPFAKPTVFNALVWIYLRHPEQKLGVTAIILKYLNHCIDISSKGASTINIEDYTIACASAHIKETLPTLKRIFNELGFTHRIFRDGYDEVEQMMNDENIHYYCQYDNMNDYLHDEVRLRDIEEVDRIVYEKEILDEEDDSIYNDEEKAKRYTIRIELLDAPEKVVRTLQVPSNIYLPPLAELLMLSFGRQDVPDLYEFSDGTNSYRPDFEDLDFGLEYWDVDDAYSFTLNTILQKKGDKASFYIKKGNKNIWRHSLTLEKSGRYSEKTEHRIELNDGQGCYPNKSTKNMNEHTARYQAGKLRQPNFDTIRKRIRIFEEDHEEVF